ncbi:MAG: lipocalin family protein [Bryobacteraceae bacterium]
MDALDPSALSSLSRGRCSLRRGARFSSGPARLSFSLTPLAFWTSPATHARYPVQWRIRIPSLKLEFECNAAIPQQELSAEDTSTGGYWEGAVTYSGDDRLCRQGQTVSGVGLWPAFER